LTAKTTYEYFDNLAKIDYREFAPIVIIESDQESISVAISELVETFQMKVLIPIMGLCDEHRLYLSDYFP
jgi:hypothetical protein